MKKILLTALSITLLCLTSCGDDDYERSVRRPIEVEPALPRVEGRIALAYVTYYGKRVPNANAYTHLNYAFAELYVREGVYEGFRLQGKESRFREVVNLKKKNPKLKILLSFTHTVDNQDNLQGGGFSALAKSAEQRRQFAEDCLAFVRTWGIDGIDIDWEFPGLSWSGHACDPAVDTDNHVLLMKQLRETLPQNILLTYAGYVKDVVSDGNGKRYIDIAAVDPYVDFVNVMTYDMDAAPHHQSALRDAGAYWDCERAVKSYSDAGVRMNKVVLGIPFYGRHSFDGAVTAINYNRIIQLDRSTYNIDNFDAKASVPYVTMNGEYYCGYDNAESIAIKGDWARNLGLAGMMCWDNDGDDKDGTLGRALWNAVMKQ